MAGHFYAFDTLAKAAKALPGYLVREDGEYVARAGAVIRTTEGGLLLTEPELGPVDFETKSQEIITPGERTAPVAILVPEAVPGAAAAEVHPLGEGGF